ncbi:sensor histidine kinase [Clostridium estertheticum]|uniref:sensor histidine kinase n=1 Tax=Clostridium estertheticum TaxID=238834 RepID=UPI0022DCFCBD|nr:HAMP domain-containing sensor histidine kinase [Clostridium estertheticum]WBL46081.1 HAMP domain-containing histidine kinase [Clostridium estertheticum]
MNYLKIGIKFKLIAFTASLLLVVISFLSISVLNGIKNYQHKQDQATLFKQKDMFEQYFSERSNLGQNGTIDKAQLARGSIFNKPWLRTIPASVYDTKGDLLSGFKVDGKLNENKDKNLMIKYAIQGKVSFIKNNNVIYFYSPIKYKNGIVAILELEYSVKESNLFYDNTKKMFYGTGFLALIFGVILGIFYFSNLTRDIYIMKDSVENIRKSDFHKILLVNRNDELGELSRGIVFMSNTIEKNIEDLEVERDSLSMAIDKLQKMDKEQKEFIGNVTHEFKTPITIIKAYAELIGMYENDLSLINDGTLNISKECDRLATMVDKVLNLSALEKYDFETQKKEVNLKETFDEICARIMGKINKNNLTFNCDVENIIVTIDEESLRIIIINLIDNAIKYNRPNGSIDIECHKNGSKITIKVADTGIGICKKDLYKIFEPFYRVESHRSRETGGAGLGLALVEKLVKKQQGTINVDSKLNVGTIFFVEFSI